MLYYYYYQEPDLSNDGSILACPFFILGSCKMETSLTLTPNYCTEVRFASFLSGRFITAIVVNPPERKLAKRTSVQWPKLYWGFDVEPEIQILKFIQFLASLSCSVLSAWHIIKRCKVAIMATLVVKFSSKGCNLDRLFAKTQHTQRKWLLFVNRHSTKQLNFVCLFVLGFWSRSGPPLLFLPDDHNRICRNPLMVSTPSGLW